jgi:hypothetical protein
MEQRLGTQSREDHGAAAAKFDAQMTKLRMQQDEPGDRVRRGIESLARIYEPRPAPIVAGDRPELYDIIARLIGDDVTLTYLEFGVYKGTSIAKMAKNFRNPSARFIGFDSFKGLPEKWDSNNDVGMFNTSGVTPQAKDRRVSFVSGYFQDTVTNFLDTHKLSDTLLVNFDADLFSSTLFLLTTLSSYYSKYYFVFDEFFPDEVNALREFALAFPIEIGFDAVVLNNIGRPVQLFGRLKRVPFTLDT